jgi:hypothetical protein
VSTTAVAPRAPRRSQTGATAVAPERPAALLDRRGPFLLAVAGLVLVAFALRTWGVKQGLPYAYNTDENAHFVPTAIGLFGHSLNPHYFVNPPGFTYLLHGVFAVWFGGREGVQSSYATDPTDVFVVARLTAAACSALAVGALALAGRRLLGPRTGLLAGAVLAVSFLPVFYSHLALNDAATLLPVCIALWALAAVVRGGCRTRDAVLCGLAIGVAVATKYTAGIYVLALVSAVVAHGVLVPAERGRAARALGAGILAVVVGFVVANPYSLLAWSEFWDGVSHQTSVSSESTGKLGFTQDNGVLYYLWTLTWGVGWVPSLAALGGMGLLWHRDRRVLLVLAPTAVLFLLFMGLQSRFFGRWLMPVLPIVCLLGAFAAVEGVRWAARRQPRLRATALALAGVALLAQGVVLTLHIDQVLSRDDTRNLVRAWMVQNLPETQPTRSGGRSVTKIVVEPVVPDGWAMDVGRPSPRTTGGNRWVKFPTSRSNLANDGSVLPGDGRVVNIEDYERTLYPELIDQYVDGGYCYVVTGSTQRGRSEAQPDVVPQAVAYYRALARRGTLVHVSSPYGEGEGPVPFNFDSSFNFRPLAYERPGPVMEVYRLRGPRCGS